MGNFSRHVNAPSNRNCWTYYAQIRAKKAVGESALKRRKLRQRREEIIRGNTAILQNPLKHKERVDSSGKEDDGIFDFDDDSPQPESFPRVATQAFKSQGFESDGSCEEEENALNKALDGETEGFHPVAEDEVIDVVNLGTEPSIEGSTTKEDVDCSHIEQFKEYVSKATLDIANFLAEMKAAIELMDMLNRVGGSLQQYDDISKWHVANSDAKGYVSAKKLHKDLRERYNLEWNAPKEMTVVLPHCKETVKLATHNIQRQTIGILTDPRLGDDDYLFFNNDPTAPPPEDLEIVGDINTSRAYRETYKAKIANEPVTKCGRHRVLCPFIFYLDGCVTGSFQSMSIEILKFTIGLLNGKARNQAWAWRVAGFMKKVVVKKKKAEENVRNSNHVDADKVLPKVGQNFSKHDSIEGPGDEFAADLYGDDEEIPEIKAQDFHKMLQAHLSTYKEMEDAGGMPWDLRHRGKLWKLMLVPFVIFCKADSVEADKFCGLYGSKTEGVQCYCRVCTCLADKSDDPYQLPVPERKTPKMIAALVKENSKESKAKLKAMSQHRIWNAMYQFEFGHHDESGVHGAIPWDILHWMQLNWFKNTRDCFFAQTGDKSQLTKEFDSLCITMGKLLQRQSDRSLPRVNFNSGVRQAMLQAHHMSGVLLVMAACFRSSQGRHLLLHTAKRDQKYYFNNESRVRDWSKVVETLLMFEQWLRKDEFEINLVNRAKVKVKEVMCMVKVVGQRQVGLGDKRGVFHGAVHIPEMILNFGAPKHCDTQFNEKDHKPDKKTAKRTQQQEEKFDMSCAEKILDRLAVQMARHELETDTKMWHYYRRLLCDEEESDEELEYELQGTYVEYVKNPTTNEFVPKLPNSRSTQKKTHHKHDHQLQTLLKHMAGILHPLIGPLPVYGELKVPTPDLEEDFQIYRAEPWYEGKPWHDWGVFSWSQDLGQHQIVLGQLKCFVDLRDLPEEGVDGRPPSIYAIMEIATPCKVPGEHTKSELFELWEKLPTTMAGFEERCNRLEIICVSRLRRPAVVVPDLGSDNPRSYMRMVPMWQWDKMFDEWLEKPHRRQWNEPDNPVVPEQNQPRRRRKKKKKKSKNKNT